MSSVWGFVRHFAARYWLWYLAGVVSLAATTWISLWIPQLSKQVVNQLTEQAQRSEMVNVTLWVMALGLLLIFCRTLSRILIFWPGQKVAADTRSWMVRLFLRLRQSYLVQSGMGDLISRMSNDVVHLRLVCGFGLLQLLNIVFMVSFALSLMLKTDVLLTLAALTPVSLMLIVTYLGMPFMSRFSREQQDVMGVLTNRVTEAFVNVQTVQTHLAHNAFEKRVEKENQKQFKVSVKLLFVRTVTFPLMIFFSGLSEVIVLFVGGNRVLEGVLTVGDILTFNVYVGLLSWPLAAVGILVSIMQRARTALDRLRTVEEAPKEEFELGEPWASEVPASHPSRGEQGAIVAPPPDSSTREGVPCIEVRSLTYSYESRPEERALDNVSFQLRSGERLGLCGPVGAGKSTLFALLTRVYEPPPGTIFVEGRDVCEWSVRELRQRVRHLGQSIHLFSESIFMNLTFGIEPQPSIDTVREACERAEIWKDIQEFPDGLQTEIGERGVRLSGGQKQRLTIARMLLRPGEVFLFDDVLSAVDTRTESRLLDTFFQLNLPFVISSHRESTLRRCDRMIHLDSGRIAFEGSFTDYQAFQRESAL